MTRSKTALALGFLTLCARPAFAGDWTNAAQYNGYGALSQDKFDVVINATAAGLHDELPPLPAGVFAANALAYEMVYGRVTPFLEFARREGARGADGLGMLVEQAAESFFIWRGVRPETAPVIALLRGS